MVAPPHRTSPRLPTPTTYWCLCENVFVVLCIVWYVRERFLALLYALLHSTLLSGPSSIVVVCICGTAAAATAGWCACVYVSFTTTL